MTLTEPERKERRRRASRRYDFLNSEERNEKTRARMARLRARTSPEDRAARRRASDEEYRRNNRALLAANARAARQRTADAKAFAQAKKTAVLEARAERLHARAVDRAQQREVVDSEGDSDSPQAPANPNLQKGERYCTFTFLPALQAHMPISYDICCAYDRNRLVAAAANAINESAEETDSETAVNKGSTDVQSQTSATT
ncbi:hypothetical protein C8F04DRAFT_1274889 [Mycena alexandri]|uniref:Uncharacterized protein n=1 Tax=Mycena alexandri TaxID=1745969 RepID=A0AAD6S026_9AGAR|nr:hypothetical protein C8F04DRAFT_1278421 [Mycena alexandri]KAJ7020584.1 hypothetical protein C8F04DRAFT_1274889 [Mycena alexandri]